ITKIPATKKMQRAPNSGAPRHFQVSERLTQVPNKPMRSIRYMDKEIPNLKKDLIWSWAKIYIYSLRLRHARKKKKKKLFPITEMTCSMMVEKKNFFNMVLNVTDSFILKQSFLSQHPGVSKMNFPTGSHCVPPSHLCLCREPLFRQLCALHWLLEALTIDHTYHTMNPVITCWNPKDPGGSKSTVKKINKDKLVQQRWEQFVNAPKTKKSKIPVVRVSHKPSRRGFTLGPSRTSGASSLQSSMVSTNPGSDEPTGVITQGTGSKKTEDNESPPTKPDEEPLHINLQKLLEMVREDARRTVMMENGMQRKAPRYVLLTPVVNKGSGSRQPETIPLCFSDRFISTNGESHSQVIQKKSKSRTNRDIIHSKTDVCSSMRAKFYSVAQEAGFVLQDKLEIFRKRQEERAHRMLQSFVITSNFKKDIAKMRHEATMVKGDADEIANHWYFQLLSKLPEDLKNFRPAQKILEKLQKFGENLDLRIRPHVLLKVLQDLRTWELCCPDIAVAIEFVREHIVHMPEEDYITWLQTRINLPI
uniref:Coiled-coil domain containing 60 n=1 Tax=Ursus maritimus TaxID=29073 RepID=A0A452TWY1_URSMA